MARASKVLAMYVCATPGLGLFTLPGVLDDVSISCQLADDSALKVASPGLVQTRPIVSSNMIAKGRV